MSKEEMDSKLKTLREYEASAQKFTSLNDVYLSYYSNKNLDDEASKISGKLGQISYRAKSMLDHIKSLEITFADQLALKEDILTPDSENNILTPELEIGFLPRTMLEASKLPARIINLASKLIMDRNSLTNININRKIKTFEGLLLTLEEEAKRQGKKAFDLVGKTSKNGLHLIKKLSQEYWDNYEKAAEAEDKQYFASIVDRKKYFDFVDEYLDNNIQKIEDSEPSTDPKQSRKIKDERIKAIKDKVDMREKSFNGYKTPEFKYVISQTVDEKRFYSKEYKAMSPNALAMWNFFTDLNKRAKKMGYIDEQGLSFLPMVEASILQKYASDDNSLDVTKGILKDLYTIKVGEEQIFSKIDPETGEVKREIPKYFTRTDKSVNQLSQDLNRLGTLWIASIEKYEMRQGMESTLDTLMSLEKSKGNLILENGKVKFDPAGNPLVTNENKNAAIMRALLDDALYDLQEDLNSLGNVTVSTVAGKLTTDEEKQSKGTIGFKKVMNLLETQVKVMAVGLKPMLGIANYAGFAFQTYINSGNLHSFSDFRKAKARLISGMSTEEKALLDLFVPLNEDVSTEKRREIAKKQGLINYLGTFSFTDIMMATNSYPERAMQFATAQSLLANTMVLNGKLVNIRQYVREQDRSKKYKMSNSERKALENSYEERVEQLKKTESLIHKVSIKGDEVSIPGVSDEELAKLRTQIVEYTRKLSGQMSADNKAGFRRDSTLSSFMMFKGWIPKQVHGRIGAIRKDTELGEWEYGRVRAW